MRSLIELAVVYTGLATALLFPELGVGPKPNQWAPGPTLKIASPMKTKEVVQEKETSSGALLQAKPTSAKRDTAEPPLAFCLPVKVTEVHDGDTAKVQVTFELTVRYANCWAPELKDPQGPKSAERAKEALGKAGRLYIDLSNVRNLADCLTFGRVIGELWLDGSQESESAKQVRLKMASTRKGGKLGE